MLLRQLISVGILVCCHGWASLSPKSRLQNGNVWRFSVSVSKEASDHVDTDVGENTTIFMDQEQSTASDSILFSRASDFLIDHEVTIQSASWVSPGAGMLPLHMYRGKKPTERRKADISQGESHSTNNAIESSLQDDLDYKRFQGMADSLSKSARTILSNWHSLSFDERNLLRNKISAETRASQPLDPVKDLHILQHDHDICVTYKPSGILSVPGPRRNPSLANLVYDVLQPECDLDQMVVHRLDMDTSGILVYALNTQALAKLHDDFRGRRVHKIYQALLVGHMPPAVSQVDIHLELERDPFHVPFMRIKRPRDMDEEEMELRDNDDVVHKSFRKMMNQAPKPSHTELRILAWEQLVDDTTGQRYPVTRVELVPHTGRTHQLRVHCAALGYPIVGDDIYGHEGAGDCGVDDESCLERAELAEQIHALGKNLCLHATQLSFYHPRTGAPILFECEPPF